MQLFLPFTGLPLPAATPPPPLLLLPRHLKMREHLRQHHERTVLVHHAKKTPQTAHALPLLLWPAPAFSHNNRVTGNYCVIRCSPLRTLPFARQQLLPLVEVRRDQGVVQQQIVDLLAVPVGRGVECPHAVPAQVLQRGHGGVEEWGVALRVALVYILFGDLALVSGDFTCQIDPFILPGNLQTAQYPILSLGLRVRN